MWAHWRHLGNTTELCYLRPTLVHDPNCKLIGSAVMHSERQKVPILYNGRPFTLKLPFLMGIGIGDRDLIGIV